MSAPDWLTERPVAHRGLHDLSRGHVENSLSAADCAVLNGFAIECDVRLSADDEAMVFHDATLDRLTGRQGSLSEKRAAELEEIELTGGADRIPRLVHLLGLVAGRVPLVVEIKSAFDGDLRLARRTAEIVRDYRGPLALKSFDPAVVAVLREIAPERPRGIVGQNVYRDHEGAPPPDMRHALANLLHYEETLPDFLSWKVSDLGTAVPHLCRVGIGMPVLTWTVRTEEDRQRARRHADQIVFEGFMP